MNLLDGMKQRSLIENDNGSLYYSTSFNSNLDLFAAASRFNETEKNIQLFNNALIEDETYALANLLYLLDIRNGKGERLIFRTLFQELCISHPS